MPIIRRQKQLDLSECEANWSAGGSYREAKALKQRNPSFKKMEP